MENKTTTIWKKRNIIGLTIQKCQAGDLLVASVAPGKPSYFWPGKKDNTRYYRSAKQAQAEKEEQAYTYGYRYNWTAALITLAIFIVGYMLAKWKYKI